MVQRGVHIGVGQIRLLSPQILPYEIMVWGSTAMATARTELAVFRKVAVRSPVKKRVADSRFVVCCATLAFPFCARCAPNVLERRPRGERKTRNLDRKTGRKPRVNLRVPVLV